MDRGGGGGGGGGGLVLLWPNPPVCFCACICMRLTFRLVMKRAAVHSRGSVRVWRSVFHGPPPPPLHIPFFFLDPPLESAAKAKPKWRRVVLSIKEKDSTYINDFTHIKVPLLILYLPRVTVPHNYRL